jgi:hypothetical protein
MADELDELYGVKPEDFTALRTRLVAAAKQRGDAATAKRIGAARKPTTAAWIVNLLIRTDKGAKHRLADLGERLREAHAAMAGERIRELSAEQRRLIEALVRAAFAAADVRDPPAALRDDIAGTLQAAVADPEVASRLGRLTKAERWSGFGDFGDTAPVLTSARSGQAKAEPTAAPPEHVEAEPEEDNRAAARREHEAARAALAAAEQARADADETVSERQAELAVARLRRDHARERLHDAERELDAAEAAYGRAKQASSEAAQLVSDAKARLRNA